MPWPFTGKVRLDTWKIVGRFLRLDGQEPPRGGGMRGGLSLPSQGGDGTGLGLELRVPRSSEIDVGPETDAARPEARATSRPRLGSKFERAGLV